MVRLHAALTRSMISGLSGSPAPTTSLRATFHAARSSWISMRQTVGGAQNVVTPQREIALSRPLALKRGWFSMNTVAVAFHGAKKQLQACLAQPGEEMLRWMSPDLAPSQYIVVSCPTG
jgi:hypothetical protein